MPTEAVAGHVVADRYELTETLGVGPMGPVWRATDRRAQRQVAVREVELPDILDDAEQAALAEKVIREATAASALDHPVAVTVLDVVTEAGQPFVVSELVTAPTLVDAVEARGPLPPEQAAAIGLQLLAALTAAHDLGLVHRDVRPSNVLLTEAGVRLADFGVASMVDNPRVAESGAMHELSYLAPEQTESAGATALSDLWSLGATLYFAVEGVPPFDGGSPTATMTAIVTQPPRPAEAAGALGPVLDALLVKEAMDRPEESHVRALLVAVAGDPAPMAPDPAPEVARSADAPPEAPVPTEEAAVPAAPHETAAAEPVPTPAATSGDERWSATAPALGPSGPLSGSPGPSGVAVDTAVEAAVKEVAVGEASPGEGSSSREPWFFQVPAETVEPPPLPEPPPRAPVEVEPDAPHRRFPHGLWVVILAVLVAGVMVALIITGGHSLRAQRPTIEKSKSVGPVSTWTPYTDSNTGFTIRYPSTWTVRRSGTQTFFVDPAGISYLEIDHQQPPAPSLVDSAMQQEKSFSASHPTYQRISIDPTTYQNSPGSLWQFTYTDAAVGIRAIDLGVNSPRYGFALYFQARADDWTRARATFDAFKSVFGIPT